MEINIKCSCNKNGLFVIMELIILLEFLIKIFYIPLK